MPLKACAHREKGIIRIGVAHSDSVRSGSGKIRNASLTTRMSGNRGACLVERR